MALLASNSITHCHIENLEISVAEQPERKDDKSLSSMKMNYCLSKNNIVVQKKE